MLPEQMTHTAVLPLLCPYCSHCSGPNSGEPCNVEVRICYEDVQQAPPPNFTFKGEVPESDLARFAIRFLSDVVCVLRS